MIANSPFSRKRAEWLALGKMANTGEDHAGVEGEESPFDRRVFRALFDLAKQYKRQFIIVSLFSFLYTGLDLTQPLVYRVAINAVAGMFVNKVPEASRLASVAARTPQQTLNTLLASVVLLFLIAVISYYFYQRATLLRVARGEPYGVEAHVWITLAMS